MDMTVTKWDESIVTRCFARLPKSGVVETTEQNLPKRPKPLEVNSEVNAGLLKINSEANDDLQVGSDYPVMINNDMSDDWSGFKDAIDWASF